MPEAPPPGKRALKVAVTGATGIVGRPITRALLAAGHSVTVFGRRPWPGPEATTFQRWSLGEKPAIASHDALIHAGFSHIPGRYRGGEGEDAAAFLRSNLDGSVTLFDAAMDAGISQCIFLSSRAVFDGYPSGTLLTEDLPPAPTTLYGTFKVEAERHLATLAAPAFRPITLRATGIYDWPESGCPHKWSDLFARFLAGETLDPAIATEVHADDLAKAVLLLLAAAAEAPGEPQTSPAHREAASTAPREGSELITVHLSDLILDRRDLLQRLSAHVPQGLLGRCRLPEPAAPGPLRILDTATLKNLGWRGGGEALLDRTLLCMAHALR